MSEQLTVQDYFQPVSTMSVQSFAQRHPFPFLLGREILEDAFSFATTISIPGEERLPKADGALHIRDWVMPFENAEDQLQAATPKVFVGRASNNALCIPHPTVSKLHAYFTRERDRWWLVDVGSSNGSAVNAMEAPPRAKTGLYDKDVIVFGRCAFTFLLPQSLYQFVQDLREGLRRQEGQK